MKQISIVFALLIGLTACDAQAKTYSGPQEIVRALGDSEIPCRDLEIEEAASIGETGHASLIDKRGVCWVDDVEVTINTFDSASEREDWLAVGGLLGPTTYGPNWVATGGSDKVIERIGRALDGSTNEA